MNSNGLQVNERKTKLQEFMTYQKRTKIGGIPPDLMVREMVTDRQGRTRWEDRHITDKSTTRMLGLNLNLNLGWDSHVNTGKGALLPALRRNLGMIARLKDSLSKKARLHLVNALIISRLTYGLCLWGNTSPKVQKQVQILINSAARLITDRKKTTRQTLLLEVCGWLPLTYLVEQYSLIQLWKTIWWQTPKYLDRKLVREPENKIYTTAPRLLLTARTFRWNTVPKWNNLPETLRSEDRITSFKKDTKVLVEGETTS